MNIEILGKQQIKKRIAPKGRVSNVRTITVDRYGNFWISVLLSNEENLSLEHSARIARDTQSGHWFICFEHGDRGFPIKRQYKSKTGVNYSPSYRFANKLSAHKILDDIKADKSAMLLVGKSRKNFLNTKWYPILTKSPLKLK